MECIFRNKYDQFLKLNKNESLQRSLSSKEVINNKHSFQKCLETSSNVKSTSNAKNFESMCKEIRDSSIFEYCTKININFEKLDSSR